MDIRDYERRLLNTIGIDAYRKRLTHKRGLLRGVRLDRETAAKAVKLVKTAESVLSSFGSKKE